MHFSSIISFENILCPLIPFYLMTFFNLIPKGFSRLVLKKKKNSILISGRVGEHVSHKPVAESEGGLGV